MKIVKTTVKDVLVLADMNRQLIRDEKHRNRMTLSQLRQRMKKWLAGDYKAYLFLDDDETVGYCLCAKTKEFVYVRHFFIKRGSRRLGFGKKAFKLMREVVWKRQTKLRLDFLINNKRAITFWKAVGFKDYCLTMEL